MAISWFEVRAEQALFNINLFRDLHPRTNFNDWKVTVLFYAALQLVHCRVSLVLGSIYDTKINDSKDKNLESHALFNDFINPIPRKDTNTGRIIRENNMNKGIQFSVLELDTNTYDAYDRLYTVSRASRYHSGMDINIINRDFTTNNQWITKGLLEDGIRDFNEVVSFIAKNHQADFEKAGFNLTPLNIP